MAADIRFYCPKCHAKLAVDYRLMGAKVPCSECKQNVSVPLRSTMDDEAPPAAAPATAPAAGGTATASAAPAGSCTKCGKKLHLTKSAVIAACQEERIPLVWGSMSPSVGMEMGAATGLNDIYDLLERNYQGRAETFGNIIARWAPDERCTVCGEQWCHRCINGPLPTSAMNKHAKCKCG